MAATVTAARDRKRIPAKSLAAADSTGYEARTVSGYFARRAGRRVHQKRWPKLTVVLDTASHFYVAARVTRGPSQDAPHLIPTSRDAVRNGPIDTMLGDAAYDSEDNHATLREDLGIRSTVIPLNWRGSRKWPKTTYRRRMVRRFRKPPRGTRSKRRYGQRWQVESGFSRSKRLLGSALRATKWVNQKAEILLKVITHNLMLLAGGA